MGAVSVPCVNVAPAESVQVKVFAVVIPSSHREFTIEVELPAFVKKPVVSPEIVPAGVAHVPSPRQYVEDEAPVPLLKRVTGR